MVYDQDCEFLLLLLGWVIMCLYLQDVCSTFGKYDHCLKSLVLLSQQIVCIISNAWLRDVALIFVCRR